MDWVRGVVVPVGCLPSTLSGARDFGGVVEGARNAGHVVQGQPILSNSRKGSGTRGQ